MMRKVEEMSLKEKIGQLFAFGFDGINPSNEIIDLIRNEKIGTIIYFTRNIKDTKQVWKLSRDLQGYSDIPLFITADQEGGIVTRFTEGVTVSPSNMAMGATSSPKHTEAASKIIGEELRILGVNMNLAPCIDVNNNPNNPVIGVRSYGEDPRKVSQLGMAAVRGYRKVKIAPVVKHFPGHGNTETDSHLDMPVISYGMEHIENIELYPFKEAIKDDVECIMISHISFPALEKSNIPATLSQSIVNGLLRQELNYKGVVMTDCMEMNAIANRYDIGEAVIMAIKAGNDIVLISHTYELQKEAINKVMKAVHEGILSEERIDQSVQRIMKLKEKLDLNSISRSWEEDKEKLAKTEHLEYMKKISEESITVVREKNFIPIKPEEKILVICPKTAIGTNVEETKDRNRTLSDILKEKHSKTYVEYININPTSEKIQVLKDIAQKFNKIIIIAYNATNNEGQKKLIKDINDKYGEKAAVISMRNPYDIKIFPNIANYFVTYDMLDMTMESMTNFLIGNIEAQGELPVTIENKKELDYVY